MKAKLITMLYWMPVVALLMLSDLYSKILAQHYHWDNIPLIPHLLTAQLAFNSGIAFGMFADGAMWLKWVIIGCSGLAIVYFLYWLYIEYKNKLLAFGIVLLIAGASGNLIERVLAGKVTDFLFLHLGSLSLFIFNLADLYISVGFCIVVLHSLLDKSTQSSQ